MKGRQRPPEEFVSQCPHHCGGGNRPVSHLTRAAGGRFCSAQMRASFATCDRVSSCALDNKFETSSEIVCGESNSDRTPNVHNQIAFLRARRVNRAANCCRGHSYKLLAHLAARSVGKLQLKIPIRVSNLVFMSLILSVIFEHSVSTTQAIIPTPQRPPAAAVAVPSGQFGAGNTWRHHEQMSSSSSGSSRQGGFASRRLTNLAASPVYRSVDEDTTTQETIDLSGEQKLASVEGQNSKILALHGQLNALRHQLEQELRKSIIRTADSIGTIEARTHRRQTQLGSPCLTSSDCSQTVKFSHCQLDTFTCSCLGQHVELNSTTCLPPALLGYECTLDVQCQQKVTESVCQLGKCACRSQGRHFVAHHKNKCLPAAKINDYCLADDQCQLSDKHSYCKWRIPNVYGTCKCPPNYKLLAGDDGRGTMRCAPRLGDTCLSDQECQLATRNSICSTGSSVAQSAVPNNATSIKHTPRRRLNWLSSSASSARCTCASGFVWSASQLECHEIVSASPKEEKLDIEQRAKPGTTTTTITTTTTTTTQVLDSHKYETVMANDKQPQVTPSPAAAAEPKPDNLLSELEIKFVPLGAGAPRPLLPPATSAKTTSTTTERPPTTSSTTTTLKPTTQRAPLEQIASGNDTIEPSKFRMSSLGKTCSSRRECQARDPYSDCIGGICECQAPSERCRARATGCHPSTFQCRNGQCISWYFVCDSFWNCDDGSDEEACHASAGCPPESFPCYSGGACLTRGKVCNGKRDCPDGSDETGCDRWSPLASGNSSTRPSTGSDCPANSFTCYNGQCLPAHVFCNAVADCADASDEDERLCGRGSPSAIVPGGSAAQPLPAPEPTTTTTTTTSTPQAPMPPATPTQGLTESPLVKTDRASIERLMAALALTQRTPEKRGRKAKMVVTDAHHQQPKQQQHQQQERQPPQATQAPTTGGPINEPAECPRWAFTCRNGKCRSSAILCSGVDGCGDNSDEDRCEVCQCEPPPTTTGKPAQRARRQHRTQAWRAPATTTTTISIDESIRGLGRELNNIGHAPPNVARA